FDTSRKVIRNADLVVAVDNIDTASRRIMNLTENLGGFVQESQFRRSESSGRISEPGGTAMLRLRIPAGEFNRLINEIGDQGTIRQERRYGDDISQQYFDSESRLRNLNAQEARYLQLLEQARNVDELIRVENELWRVRSQIESLAGQLRYWDSLVDMATVSVTLEKPGAGDVPGGSLGQRLQQIFERAADSILTGLETLVVSLAWLAPWVAAGGLVWLVLQRRPSRGSSKEG
ncbi:MAG: DUF4349 domain-containing protein, partial [Thermaerobacterales bacterium]